MFGTKTQRRPTDSEFLHSESCPTPKAEPGWDTWAANGRGSVTVAAKSGMRRMSDSTRTRRPRNRVGKRISTLRAARRPKSRRSSGSRDGSTAGWRSTCSVCTSQWVYFWRPDLVDKHGRPVRREANVLYTYELAHQPVPA